MKNILFFISFIICLNSYSENKYDPPVGRFGMPYVKLYQFHRKLGKGYNKYYYDTRIFVESDKGKRDGPVCNVWDIEAPGTVPLYLYVITPDYYYYDTNPAAPHTGHKVGIVCYIYKDRIPGSIPLYEYLYPRTDLYYYDTRDFVEEDKGYVNRIVGYVMPL